ncbi:hypothetical protein FHS25_005179 [Rhizobium laguerreae]|uniref:3-isopropylmalate dehydrogenase n=1 Tax=Rhizobium laguerreae TaxID=1076926 RepID=A0ABR6GEG1_9HYPH|nr:hypothetical protein [Rhizobium laguerreae]MBB3164676.1 hypothetical protein [Rhizobium laguerreae]OOO46411.1 hypothetical protein BS630_25485 [Rhizobium laguerreae]
MTLILDPAMRVIEKDHQIFVLHPGDGKRFYNDFIATSSIFLDIPGIKFETSPDIGDEGVRQQLRMSRAIGGWHKSGRPEARKPSRLIEDYGVKLEGRDAPRYMREVKNLYVDAKPGDLFVIPGPGYNSRVLLAELSEDFDPDFRVDIARYGADRVPARRVTFIQTESAKYEFGQRAIQLMQNRQAIIRVSDDHDRHEFYEHAYGDYVWGDVSGSYMEVTEQVIDQKDLTDVLFLTNLYGAMYVALKAGELETFIGLPLHVAINQYYNRELFGDISIEVHSPGFFGRPMKNPAIAGFVAAMTVLATMGASPLAATTIEVQNSANGRVSACDLELEADVRSTMQIVTNAHAWWDDLCKTQKAAADQTGLKTKAKIVDKPTDND